MKIKCKSCTILIGKNHIETVENKVGQYTLCNKCYNKLIDQGYIELDDRKWDKEDGVTCTVLYKDGTSKKTHCFLRLSDHKFCYIPLDEKVDRSIYLPIE